MTSIALSKRASGWLEVGVFLAGAAGMFAATRGLIPRLAEAGWHPLLAWFTAAASLVFVPILLLGFAVLRSESDHADLVGRLRLRRMTRRDWAWTALGMGLITALSGAATVFVDQVLGASLHPPFLRFEPLSGSQVWILAVWLPFWILNVLGEEITWRGVLLPRQEALYGRRAWLVQAGLWTVFHLAFGFAPLLMMLPILFVVPWVAQRTGNTTTAIVLHGLANGPAFVLIALGVL